MGTQELPMLGACAIDDFFFSRGVLGFCLVALEIYAMIWGFLSRFVGGTNASFSIRHTLPRYQHQYLSFFLSLAPIITLNRFYIQQSLPVYLNIT